MILKRLKLVNYGGIYNGLGLNEIEIDFTKCQHRIILIKGDNGSGKSTIEGALKPLPDDNTSFIPNKDAMKEIEYIDEITGTVYSIRFVHECKGNSRTTKGYISKFSNGFLSELNPSGNITSCKEVIYEELQLDPNYITLSQLSSNKRGIADLKPAERKRYVNAILSTTDVYNDMHKTLSKKASAYKGMMQSIVAKLDTIGNVTQLEQSIKTLEERITTAEEMIEQHTEVMNKELGMLHSIDPDSKIADKIEYLTNTLAEYTKKRDEVDKELRKLHQLYPNVITLTVTESMINDMNNLLITLSNKITSIRSKIGVILESRQCDADELQAKTAKLKSINSAGSLAEVKKVKASLNQRKYDIEQRWQDIVSLGNLTSDDFLYIYKSLVEMLSIMADTKTIIPQQNISLEYNKTSNAIKVIDEEIEDIINDRNRMIAAEDKLSILEQRPTECTIDRCPFIADALRARQIIDSARKHSKTLKQLNAEKDALQEYLLCIDNNKQLINLYRGNQTVLRYLNFGLDDYDKCISTLRINGNQILATLKGMLNYANDLEEYKKILKSISDIDSKFNSLSSQEDFINMITSDIDKLQKQINSDNATIDQYNLELDKLNEEYKQTEQRIQLFVQLFEKRGSIQQLNEAIKILQEEIDMNKANIDKVQKINSDIEKLRVNISELKQQLSPLREQRDSLRYKLNISMEYNKELNEYQAMYEKIDTLKYYCSPTTGIQLLFVQMYLSKIMDNANRILCGLFGGVFALLPLVITDTEFKIPVAVNGGLNHDDITSMSSAQVALISMIISIALLSQTSTKLNIIVGDEIDAPFDSENRREFITILYQLMSLVKASQCVLISHNSEIPMSECDVILLKCDNDVITDGNVIWSYR